MLQGSVGPGTDIDMVITVNSSVVRAIFVDQTSTDWTQLPTEAYTSARRQQGHLHQLISSDMPYVSIETVAYSTGLFMAGIKITGRGTANYQIENVAKNEVQAFVDVVRTHLMAKNIAAQTTNNTSAHLVADEIEKLASLMERGFLTSQEFDAKKKQLLEI